TLHINVCLHLFFFTHHHQTASTLFPYTTLFRSRTPPVGCATCSCVKKTQTPCSSARRSRAGGSSRANAAASNGIAWPMSKVFGSDRKSTRLNSSHDQISYAVFCLKKKTNIGTQK